VKDEILSHVVVGKYPMLPPISLYRELYYTNNGNSPLTIFNIELASGGKSHKGLSIETLLPIELLPESTAILPIFLRPDFFELDLDTELIFTTDVLDYVRIPV